MSARDITVLKELRALIQKKAEVDEENLLQKKRVSHIDDQIESKKEYLDQYKIRQEEYQTCLNSMETRLAKLEISLSQAKSHVLEMKSEKQVQLLEKEIIQLEGDIDKMQSSILETLDESEENFSNLELTKEFLTNSKTTLAEVSAEVNAFLKEKQLLIDDIKIEKSKLIEILSGPARELILATEKKFQGKFYFCDLSTRNCAQCGSLQESDSIESIQKQDAIVSCTNCGRIFILD